MDEATGLSDDEIASTHERIADRLEPREAGRFRIAAHVIEPMQCGSLALLDRLLRGRDAGCRARSESAEPETSRHRRLVARAARVER
jgi:hypothetical protein